MKSFILLIFACVFQAIPVLGKDVVWFNGTTNVTYDYYGKHSAVMDLALNMFAEDMRLVTGHKAEKRKGGVIEIFELNGMSDKDFRKLQKRNVPIDKIIAKKNAFYVGTDDGHVVVCGSDEYGTAYGVLELSRLAGVSPWVWWGDVVPAKKHYLGMNRTYKTIQWPSIDYRGFTVTGSVHTKKKELERLLLRLRGNTMTQKHHRGTTLFLPEKWLPSTQPGRIFAELKEAFKNGLTTEWIADIDNPKVVAYQLSLFMDMAWNVNYISASNVQDHFRTWLDELFGEVLGARLLPIMTEYYHLVGICRPETMNAPFAADAFGNELERYIANFKDLCKDLETIEPLIPKSLEGAYFAAIKYPICAAWLMAEKQLQAQEARDIARPSAFHHDKEALASAVRSWKAHSELMQLIKTYENSLARGKWKNTQNIGDNALIVGNPQFPGSLTSEEIKRFSSAGSVPFSFDTGSAIVRNACKYRKATQGVRPVEMLGHSMKAVYVPKGESISFSFYTELKGQARFRIAAIPMQILSGHDVAFQVKIDDQKPEMFYVSSAKGSEQWENDRLRGQTVKSMDTYLTQNSHDLVITALTEGVFIDQIMIDYDLSRLFYMFPVASGLH